MDSYWDLYQRLGEDAPAEVRDTGYRDRLVRAYPFHPQLIDLLFERWSTFPTFQRTRGVLRLLALVVGDLYQRASTAPLIQTSQVNLGESAVLRELLKHIGNEYQGVVASDIADGNARAPRLDRELGSEYARYGIASGLATSVFLGSFSGGERHGLGVGALRVAVLRDGIPPAIVGDTLQRLESSLWYLHIESGRYLFRSQANLNRILVDQQEQVRDDDLTAELRNRLERQAGGELRVIPFPKSPADVPDTRELKLAVLDGERTRSARDQLVKSLLNQASGTFRAYRNTLFVLAPDEAELTTLRQRIKYYLALRAIQSDRSLSRSLSDESRQILETRFRDVDGGIGFQLLSAYRHLARAHDDGVEWYDLGLPTIGERSSLAARVRRFLQGQDVLLDSVAPRRLLQWTLASGEESKPVPEVADAFRRYPNLPVLASDDALYRAVRLGVPEGSFGVRVGGRVYFRESLPSSVEWGEAALLRPELAAREATAPEPPAEAAPAANEIGQPAPSAHCIAEGSAAAAGPAVAPAVHALTLRVGLPWDKLSDVVRGVLLPLSSDGASLTVELALTARSPSGIRQDTLDNKVRETLRQIGATVLEERAE
ncbi:MAG: DUF499 domain-containing protein [Candidatus Dormibacteraceae bacterium]